MSSKPPPIVLFPSASTGINRLPDELLSEVFMYTHDILVKSKVHHGGRPMCVRLSRVSRRWRHVAITCQYLWAQLLGDFGQEWSWVCLQRAHSVPLDLDLVNLTIEWWNNHSNAFEITRELLRAIPRARTIDAYCQMDWPMHAAQLLNGLARPR